MAFTNFESKEVNCKVIYFGPSSSGKTANLRSIYQQTSPDAKNNIVDFSEVGQPTQYFDFLPVSLGHIRDYHLKMHLYALPNHNLYPTLPNLVLKGMDGFIFVADSRLESIKDNIESMQQMKSLLSNHGINISDLPRVIQYNKRDMNQIVSIEALRHELNQGSAPEVEAIAVRSVGTLETLQMMAKQVLMRLIPQDQN